MKFHKIKGLIEWEDTTIVNLHAPNNRAEQYTKQKTDRRKETNRQICNHNWRF